jgi:hypothetical protein
MESLAKLAKKVTKTDITKLTRDDFSSPELRAKYFRHDNRNLDRLHLPAMTAEVYEPIANEEFNNSRMNPANLKFATASSYYIKKAQLFVLACDLGVSPKLLDSSNYIWNEDYYIHSNFLVNLNIVEDLYRERGSDERLASAYTVYVKQDAKCSSADMELWNSLYNFCYTAIVTRKAMLMHKISQCLSFLVSVQEYSYGFTENVTAAQVATMKSYATFFKELLDNEEALAFIKSTNDIEIFANNEATHRDYVETYRTLIRRASGCNGEEIEQFKTDLSQIEDPHFEEITAKELDADDFLSGMYLENEDGDSETGYEEILGEE